MKANEIKMQKLSQWLEMRVLKSSIEEFDDCVMDLRCILTLKNFKQ
jgi:hypothetical protein